MVFVVAAALAAIEDESKRLSDPECLKPLAVSAAFALELQMPETKGTIGGIIASGRVPEIARILLGLEIANAEGVYMNFSQQTLKAAKGYDMCSMFCGSRGAYGVILSAVFRTCLINEKKEFPESSPVPFSPNRIHKAFKEAADPENLLNPWLYPQKEENNGTRQ